jgi:hypothetical protein
MAVGEGRPKPAEMNGDSRYLFVALHDAQTGTWDLNDHLNDPMTSRNDLKELKFSMNETAAEL